MSPDRTRAAQSRAMGPGSAAIPGPLLPGPAPGDGSLADPCLARAGVSANRQLAAGIHWIDLALPSGWGPPAPGQFVSLSLDPPPREDEPGGCGGGVARRPFSVARFETRAGHASLGLLYSPIGRVTRRLALLAPGAEIDLLGPLGTAFPLPPQGAPATPSMPGAGPFHLVGGGRGIAPLLFTADRLRESGADFALYYGTRTAAEALAPERLPRGALHQATDDGSLGSRGSVIDLLDRVAPTGGVLFACGPHGMLSALAAWAGRRSLPCWVSIEENFGCGLGTCGGCAVPAVDPPGSYLWACSDGAVLPAGALDWGRWGGTGADRGRFPDPNCGAEEV